MLLLAEDLVERVGQIIPRYNMLSAGGNLGVAVSGGADSVVLLHVLYRLISSLAMHLTVLHVNHGLRGAESDGDEQFVRELSRALGLDFLRTAAPPARGNLEQEARRLRREFFSKCREERGLQRIALGHTRSDQAETVLFRFLRGSGIAGLAGMRPVTHDGFIRPLLHTSRAEVRTWAKTEGIPWREDRSNSDDRFARNLLRNKVMPMLSQEFNSNLEGILAGLATVAAAEEDYWQAHTEPIYKETIRRSDFGLVLRVDALAGNPSAVQRRLIRSAVAELRGDLRGIDLLHIDAILKLCRSEHGHDRIVIPGVDAIRSFGVLLLARPGELSAQPRNYCIELNWNEKVNLPFRMGAIKLYEPDSNGQNCVNFKKESQYPKEVDDVDFEALTSRGIGRFQVRNWRPGDEMLRPGHQKPEKIKSLFQEFQVLLWQRRHWPVVALNDEVFWARGFGVAFPYSARPESVRVARLCYWPGNDC